MTSSARNDCLKRLRNLCAWYGNVRQDDNTETILARLQKELATPLFRGFFRELGVCVGGFLYLDHGVRRVKYAFFSDARDATDSYMIQYQDYGWSPDGIATANADEDIAAFRQAIDSLFYIHRHNQTPFEPPRGNFTEPEYLRDLPISTLPNRCLASLHADSALDERVRSDFGIHYVPYGEHLAFLLMWRRLLRRIQGTTPTPWSTVLWETDTYEGVLARVMEEHGGNIAYLPQGQNLWKFVSQYERPVWAEDLAQMLIAPNGEKGERGIGFKALLTFIGLLRHPPKLPDTSGPAEMESVADALLERNDICGLPRDERDRRRLSDAVRRLHGLSRFPILPYYFWSAVSRRPRTHAVVPIWASISSPLRHPVFTPIVGVAVLDLVPLAELDPTWNEAYSCYSRVDKGRSSAARLYDIIEIARLISQTQIDAIFYQERLKAQVNEDLAAGAYKIGHPMKDRVGPLRAALTSIAEGINTGQSIDQLRQLLGEALRSAARIEALGHLLDMISRAISSGMKERTFTSKPAVWMSGDPYAIAHALRETKAQVDKVEAYNLVIADQAWAIVDPLYIGRWIGGNARPADLFYDEILAEVLTNAARRGRIEAGSVVLHVSHERIPDPEYGEPVRSLVFSNVARRPVPLEALRLSANEWRPWDIGSTGAVGGLFFIAMCLQSTNAGRLYARVEREGPRDTFRIGLRLHGLNG